MTCRSRLTDLTAEVVAGAAAQDGTSPSRHAPLDEHLAIISLATTCLCLHHPPPNSVSPVGSLQFSS
jgi:hypothetical protein